VGVAVAAPDGRVWEVRRVWARRPRWREIDLGDLSPADALTFADGDIGGFILGIVVGLLLLVALGIFIVVLLPLVLLVLEALVLAFGV
jgi:hypothetical protein